ncbi:hypothetical protein C1752_18630 [Acaryochloris thomasi RCC1774]|uniref:Uncharacterized protein n=1 Tax=Acaryochloris thomasi RCC1774 TaxID=1764569 RepID=A0A2W1J7F5_9CYAN|nr:hypothetical protein C1752_18630 [Acaryochloris thomasi RCC1774]
MQKLVTIYLDREGYRIRGQSDLVPKKWTVKLESHRLS